MDYIAAADAWFHAHPYALAAAAAASAHRRLLFRYALLGALKTKLGRRILLGDEDEILQDLDDARQIIKEVVDKAKAEEAASAKPAP